MCAYVYVLIWMDGCMYVFMYVYMHVYMHVYILVKRVLLP